uniref:Putative secreted peptide n=1 Tax=Anopheles braziliensis TaxID=58242 RepID=A0A2M3ZPS9_9DIPT
MLPSHATLRMCVCVCVFLSVHALLTVTYFVKIIIIKKNRNGDSDTTLFLSAGAKKDVPRFRVPPFFLARKIPDPRLASEGRMLNTLVESKSIALTSRASRTV